MKTGRLLVLVLVVALGSAALAGPFRLPSGTDPIEVSLFGASSLYDGSEPDPLARTARPNDVPVVIEGDELRGIAYIDAIGYLDMSVDPPVQRTAFNPEFDGFELSAIYHGLRVSSVMTLSFGAVTYIHLEYEPMADQTVAVLGDEDGDPIPGAGGRVTFYRDVSADFAWDPDGNATPDDWTAGPGGAGESRLDYGTAGVYDALAADELGGDVSIFADAVFVPLKPYGLTDDPDVVLIADLFYSPAFGGEYGGMYGVAQGYANSIRDGVGPATNSVDLYSTDSGGGTVNASGITMYHFGDDAEDRGGDFRVFMDIGWGSLRQPRLTQMGETGWAFSNNDPVTFINSPEPATTLLFGIPLGVLIRKLRRRRKTSA